jgi:hypothetical protein
VCTGFLFRFQKLNFGRFANAAAQHVFRPYRADDKSGVRIYPGHQPGLEYFALAALEIPNRINHYQNSLNLCTILCTMTTLKTSLQSRLPDSSNLDRLVSRTLTGDRGMTKRYWRSDNRGVF